MSHYGACLCRQVNSNVRFVSKRGGNLKVENGRIEGDFVVSGQFTLNGMVTGTTTVAPGASLQLHGMCCGDLVVSSGATAVLHGTVIGNLVNKGVTELRGVIQGNVLSKGAHFQRSLSSVINGAIET